MTPQHNEPHSHTAPHGQIGPIGRIVLIAAYGVLGLAATGRSVVQITTKLADAPVPYLLSGASALLYIVIAVALWRGWRTTALWGTATELVGVLAVGTVGLLAPHLWADETVWTGYGSAYGWVPLVLPIAALWVLLRRRPQPSDKAPPA